MLVILLLIYYIYRSNGLIMSHFKALTAQFTLMNAFIPGLHHWQC